jgi:hypothetical protein
MTSAASRRVMQAEGDVIRLPAAEPAPPDFAAFFAEEHAGLFKALYFVTENRSDAAELAQDAFLKLWERWDRVMSSDGSDQHPIASPSAIAYEAAWAPAWSPDGTRIVALRFDENPVHEQGIVRRPRHAVEVGRHAESRVGGEPGFEVEDDDVQEWHYD